MNTRRFLVVACLMAAAPAGRAQHDGHHPPDAPASATGRTVAALDSSEVAALLGGQGMGLARAAELNGYPGPLHVIELAGPLGLTAGQRATAESLRAGVLAEARAIGEAIVDREMELDAVFTDGHATPAAVDALTSAIAELGGRLRAVHLRAHIGMRAALTEEQVASYNRLRGNTRQ